MPLRILAVSPRCAPTNGADTHRLRLLLNHATASGWHVEVLAVHAADVVGPIDPWLEARLPTDASIHRVRAFQLKGWGLNGLAQRSLCPLYRKGCELLATGRFDLVFFSTTEFALHVLGPLWRSKHGVPFCMDYQDPWVNQYYQNHPEVVPPGGRLKFAVADRVHRMMERFVVRRCAGFIAVSSAYLEDLTQRYGHLVAGKPMLARPFPAEPAELDALRAGTERRSNNQVQMVWRYIGRGGPDMVKAASAFFRAWLHAIEARLLPADASRFEAHGTSYAAAGNGQKSFEQLVEGTELAPQVLERPDRLGYSDMLRALLRSDALVVFGSDDPAYTASKIYPYLLAGKPLLAIFHENSSVVRLMREARGGTCVTFNERTSEEELARAIGEVWFTQDRYRQVVALDQEAFEPYTARAQAQGVGQWLCDVSAKYRLMVDL
jgi:Glycosyl transferase 4-like domain